MLIESLDDFLGPRYEEAFRQHLRVRAAAGEFGDVVALAGRSRAAVLVGEAKWARVVDARRIETALARRATALPTVAQDLRLAVAGREKVQRAGPATFVVTASDIFGVAAPRRRANPRRAFLDGAARGDARRDVPLL